MKPANSTGSRLLRKPCRGCSSFTRPRRSVSRVMSASSGTRSLDDYAAGGWSALIFCMTKPVANLGWK
jgi:hypothetical protein